MSAERSTARVLVADDDEDILDLVRMVLEEDGYEVVGAARRRGGARRWPWSARPTSASST